MQKRILDIIVKRRNMNMRTTSKTIGDELKLPLNNFSGRITSLKKKGLVEVETDHEGKEVEIDGAAILIPTQKGLEKFYE